MDKLLDRLRKSNWKLESWNVSPALFSREPNGPSKKYVGGAYDESKWEYVEDGWGHDHCPICFATFSDYPSEEYITEGYTDGNEWVCKECYFKYIFTNNDDKT